MSTRKRTSLSAAQKRELCEAKKYNPSINNVELAREYNIGKATTDILKEKERWLSITTEQANLKKFREPNWPKLEQALSLWVDNALYSQQDITGSILKEKANQFANKVSINNFRSSDVLYVSWNLCPFGMDICQMGIYVHSKWTYVRLES